MYYCHVLYSCVHICKHTNSRYKVEICARSLTRTVALHPPQTSNVNVYLDVSSTSHHPKHNILHPLFWNAFITLFKFFELFRQVLKPSEFSNIGLLQRPTPSEQRSRLPVTICYRTDMHSRKLGGGGAEWAGCGRPKKAWLGDSRVRGLAAHGAGTV
jgi:hypothetical protein